MITWKRVNTCHESNQSDEPCQTAIGKHKTDRNPVDLRYMTQRHAYQANSDDYIVAEEDDCKFPSFKYATIHCSRELGRINRRRLMQNVEWRLLSSLSSMNYDYASGSNSSSLSTGSFGSISSPIYTLIVSSKSNNILQVNSLSYRIESPYPSVVEPPLYSPHRYYQARQRIQSCSHLSLLIRPELVFSTFQKSVYP